MAKTITLREAQAAYAAALEQVKSTGEPLVVEQDGQPSVVVIPYAEYQQLVARREGERKQTEQDEGFEREYAAFLRLKSELLKTHRGLFVAVHNGQVVDSDTDNLELAKRIYAKQWSPVCIDLVNEEPRIADLPSPEEAWHVSL